MANMKDKSMSSGNFSLKISKVYLHAMWRIYISLECVPQEGNDIVAQRGLTRQQQCGQVARMLLLLGTVHDQAPVLIVRVQHVGVIDALVCKRYK